MLSGIRAFHSGPHAGAHTPCGTRPSFFIFPSSARDHLLHAGFWLVLTSIAALFFFGFFWLRPFHDTNHQADLAGVDEQAVRGCGVRDTDHGHGHHHATETTETTASETANVPTSATGARSADGGGILGLGLILAAFFSFFPRRFNARCDQTTELRSKAHPLVGTRAIPVILRCHSPG